MFTIFVRQLEIVMSVGIYPEERQARQRVSMDIEAECCLQDNLSDSIEHTVSYEDFVNAAQSLADQKHFNLLETYAQELADHLLQDPRISTLSLNCEKPDIFKGNPKSVGVRLSRTRTYSP